MKTMLTYIDLVIECRDYRVPLTSRNPLFEENLAGRERLIVYTKQDLGSEGRQQDRSVCTLQDMYAIITRVEADSLQRERLIQEWQRPSSVLFSDHKDKSSVRKVLNFARDHASAKDSLMGSRMMIVGMPNVGKSSLLNALRQVGIHKGKAAHTGAQPGVTRKIGTTVKIIGGDEKNEGVYLMDTPGVFVPYVPNAESMLKLALCGSVKDTIIAPTTLADYLLYQMNIYDPEIYADYASPTNDVVEFLSAVAQKTGRLQKGGTPDVDASALWMIQRWRNGLLGRFMLDHVTEGNLERERRDSEGLGSSLNHARRADKDMRRQRSKEKYLNAG
ncbi:MAG: Mitochondrial GTPase [Alectoria sarmentosa]|nr:MAG: Mitochondrial GTPase [Alectoria sarmentosa]